MADSASPTASIVVLISGSGTNLQALIDQTVHGTIAARIAAVISNRPGAGGIDRARQAGITTELLDHTNFQDREAFDEKLAETILRYKPDIVVLAGFMRILTPAFVRQFQGKMVNIHPSLLPKYKGLHTHKRALEAGDTEHGATVHFVTEELDGGPNIIQARVDIEENDTPESLAGKVLLKEHQIFPQVIKWMAEQRLSMTDNRAYLDDIIIPENGLQFEA
ncbi:phosphoribosylglycinamide formyltransferase [Oleiphilus messinensis]|uniref:Phosphoribosylglycinamide formyltransferase n=1 Tax=Oleiphilus messinensis TaxID=141451 RepID=A0A1Y0IAV1_9GAMM|nr:phosphoribosylglycinamide formyltransferase [Oleiphilus messinensis]ARU57647.1 phosphoribosylglycinamide formyltransferase [Oleiphilus messinensis]